MSIPVQVLDPRAFRLRDAPARSAARAPEVPAAWSDAEAFRVDLRSLSGMQKEAIVSRLVPGGAAWRLVSDEGPYLKGTDLAPFPLGYFAAGLQFDLIGELLRHARMRGVAVGSLAAMQDTRYTMEGSALRGDMRGGALPVDVVLRLASDATDGMLVEIVRAALAGSRALALLREPLDNRFALTVEGRGLSPGVLREAPGEGVTDPESSFAHLAPSAMPTHPAPVTKVADADVLHGVEGGVGSSLQAEQRRTLHVRAEATLAPDGIVETTVRLFKPLGSVFGFACDVGADRAEAARTPSPLAYLSAGIAFCYMTQLGRYAVIVKQRVRSMRIVQLTAFGRLPGPGAPAVTAPVDTHVFYEADEPADAVAKAVSMGEQTCFLHAAMRGRIAVAVTVHHHGTRLPPITS